jgi:pimeloyl-ACP methyl ester carboxylesterase
MERPALTPNSSAPICDTSVGAGSRQHEPGLAECCGGGDETHNCSITSTEGVIRPGPLDGCPTPLGWKQVLETFHEQSTAWEVPRSNYTLRGRTWGNGPPLYLLCGMGGTSDSFCLLVYLLRDLFRCVVFDYPGTRDATSAGSNSKLESLRDDLLAIADFHGDRHFDLFATSFGSLVALETLLIAPDRVGHAVIQGGFCHRNLSFAERAIVRVGSLLPGRLRSLPGSKLVQEQNHRRWFPSLDPSRWQFFVDDAGQVSNATLAWRGALIRDTDLRSVLTLIQQPVLLIQCEGDGLVSRNCYDELAQGLPNAKTEWMHSAGHVPHLTNPHRLAKSIRDFLLPRPPAEETKACEPQPQKAKA